MTKHRVSGVPYEVDLINDLDSKIQSPCIEVCEIVPEIGLCAGCYRSRMEIREWPLMDDKNKETLLAIIRDRKERYGED